MNTALLENERLIDERDALERRIKSAADAKLTELEAKFETTIAQSRIDAHHQIEAIQAELEQLRRAARGDPCGWEEHDDGTFFNNESGEHGIMKIPEALAFARAVQRVDDLGSQEEAAKTAKQNAKNAERKRRELDVKLNEARSDARAQRELLANWTASAGTIATSLSSYYSSLESTCDNLHSKHEILAKKNDSLHQSAIKVSHAAVLIQRLRDALSEARISKGDLETRILQLQTSFGDIQQELYGLRTSLGTAVEAEVKPIRLEMSKARDALSRERLARAVERQQLAAAWPPEHLAPMALRRYLEVTDSRRKQLSDAACAAAADATIRREIRRRVADALRWTQTTDDYGRKYFVHLDTGEAAWEAPSEMLYQPPPGRDELGNPSSVGHVDQLDDGLQSEIYTDSNQMKARKVCVVRVVNS